MRLFVRDQILPLETLPLSYDAMLEAIKPLQAEVKIRGLWASHLPPELGGDGFGQVKLALMHEILGRSPYAPVVFGNQAPDSGNAELLAIGVESSRTEGPRTMAAAPARRPDALCFLHDRAGVAGSDPTLIRTTAVLDGDEYVINGHKWFTSNGSKSDFLIVMVVTNPDVHAYQGCSMIVVPTKTPGVNIVRDVPNMHHPYAHPGRRHPGGHAEIRYDDVRVPAANLIARPGDGFLLAQKRLGPGRLHHAMRWIGQSRRAFDMLCERALSRYSHGSLLAEKQMIQDFVAESLIDIETARLLCLNAAWKIDQVGSSKPAPRSP